MGIQKLPLRLLKCIDRNGDYVEKWVHVQDSTDVSKIENKCLFYIFKQRRPYFWNYPRSINFIPKLFLRQCKNVRTLVNNLSTCYRRIGRSSTVESTRGFIELRRREFLL
jgi:hypothetical protein